MKKKIVFLVTSLSWKKFKQFNIEMSKYYKMIWITIDTNIYYSFKRHGFNNIQLLDFSKIYNKNKKLKLSEIQKIVDHNVNKYNILNLRNIFLAANMYKTLNPYKAYNVKEYYLKFISLIECFEKFLDNYSETDIVLQWLGAELERRILRLICEKRHIPHFVFDFSPIKGCYIFGRNEYVQLYNIKMRKIDKEEAEKYLEKYKTEKINFIHPKQKSIITINNLIKFLRVEKKAFYLQSIIRSNIRNAKRRVRNLVKNIILLWLYQKPPIGKHLIFFPLHDPAESQVTISLRSSGFIDQVILIKLISLNTPDDYQILVKEHPNVLGKMKLTDLLTIKRLRNVSLVNPKISAHELIKLSDIIMTVNSTVGFEALLYQKPVITFGKSFYRGKGLTLDINSISELPLKLKEAEMFRPKYEKVIEFLKDIMELSIEGNFECPQLLVQNIHRFFDIYFSK